jgi:hypothetical protein
MNAIEKSTALKGRARRLASSNALLARHRAKRIALAAARNRGARRRWANALDLARRPHSISARWPDLGESENQLASRAEMRDERLAKEGIAGRRERIGHGTSRRIDSE